MIKFFRNIRKNLLMQDKTSKYFKYAIGEIILVVIGILIALQINNWNENQTIKGKNAIILQNLNDEFNENLTEINNDIQRLDTVIVAIKEVMSIMTDSEAEITQKEFDLLLSRTFTTPSWSPSSFVLIELKNSGALTQLNDNALKKLLFKWERQYSKMKQVQDDYDLYSAEYIEFITKYGSVRNLDALMGTIKTLEPSSIAINPISFLNNREFENRLENFYFLAYRLRNDYKSLTLLMNEIIKATETND
ncbi:DUF6090 family protein [Winogradskyella sp. A3E31]|uniref:DUF6090 family protein n=1 Tax=Winogradskyella sp. A3E31 TaxID=3349637 RepID=UPI00398A6A4B